MMRHDQPHLSFTSDIPLTLLALFLLELFCSQNTPRGIEYNVYVKDYSCQYIPNISIHRYIGCLDEIEVQCFKTIRLSNWAKLGSTLKLLFPAGLGYTSY